MWLSKNRSELKEIRICKECGEKYLKNKKYSQTQWLFSKFCSYRCHSSFKSKKANIKRKEIKRKCIQCGKEFFKKKSYGIAQWNMIKFCSIMCSANFRRKYKNSSERGLAYRRRKGMLKKGSIEEKEKISHLTKLAMQRPEVKEKIRQPRKALSLEHRIKLSNANMGKMPQNMMFSGNGSYPHILRGDYDINGTTMYFRSKWEANYALFLDFLIDHGDILKWEYEPDTFEFEQIRFGTRSYTPDFKIFNKNGTIEYHEVKGYMDSRSKTKLKRMRKYYPKISLKLIDSSEYNLIKKQIGKLCKFY